MRAIIQRVSQASVAIEGRTCGVIGPGLLILIGIAPADDDTAALWLARKIAALRIFEDAVGQMNRSLIDTGGGALVVSQFTLFASTRKGTRPSFNDAASPTIARPLYACFVRHLSEALGGKPIAEGEFGANMQVTLTNDGPVTLLIDTQQKE